MILPPAYLDACVDTWLAPELSRTGYLTHTARSVGLEFAEDERQLHYAAERQLVLITHNNRHFHALHRAWLLDGRSHAGIVSLPMTRLTIVSIRREQLRLRTLLMLQLLVEQTTTRGIFLAWGDVQSRLDAGERPAGYTEAEVGLARGVVSPGG